MCTTIVSVGELFSVVTPIWRPHTTCGGDTSGYSEIGNLNSAISPTRNTMIDSTAAKRGRSMKKWETSMVRRLKPLWLSGGHRRLLADRHALVVDRQLLRGHRHARADPLQAVDHDQVTGKQAAR